MLFQITISYILRNLLQLHLSDFARAALNLNSILRLSNIPPHFGRFEFGEYTAVFSRVLRDSIWRYVGPSVGPKPVCFLGFFCPCPPARD